jgi:hypothetical protein
MDLLRRFRENDRGAVAIVFAVALIPIMGLSGAAIDYTRATQAKTKLQAAADSAALAALTVKASSLSQRELAARTVFEANRPADMTPSATYAVGKKEAVVTATGEVSTSMLKVLRINDIGLRARAKAVRIFDGPPPCILTLSAAASPAIDMTGNTAFTGNGCVLHANSSANGAISVGGSATVSADGYCAVGTVVSGFTLTPPPENGCEVMEDPYKDLAYLGSTTCDPSLKSISVQPNTSKNLGPGVYCGGLDLKGMVTLQKGLYVIKDGNLSIGSQANVTGSEVTFYFVGGSTFDINGGSRLELSASTEKEPFGGLLFIQDPTAPLGLTKLNGNSNTILKGAIYMPKSRVEVTGNGTFGVSSPFMPIIADTVKMSGSSVQKTDETSVKLPKPLPKSASGARLAE